MRSVRCSKATEETGPLAVVDHDVDFNLARSSFTLEAWVLVGEQSGVILEKLNDTDGFCFGIDSTGNAYLLLRRAGVEEVYESDFLVPRERWVHLTIERKGKTLTFYQDGIADGLTASQTTSDPATGDMSGGDPVSGDPV